MSRNPIPVVLSLVLLAGCATSTKTMTPSANTRDAVMSYVNNAANVVAKSGPSCDTFSQPTWRAGDYYVFVVGPDNQILCHPNAQLIGKLQSEIIDVNGMHVGDALGTAAASAAGHGWVDYVWPRPGTTTPIAKSTYVTRATGPDGKVYMVGGGGYQLQ
jgi:signal transduction histidine kinase